MAYNIINLIQVIGTNAEGRILSDLLSFECCVNEDVEKFLHERALEFAKRGLSQTHLVYTSFKGKQVLCGYYTLSTKWIKIKKRAMPSKNMIRKFNQVGSFDSETNEYGLVVPLIGQLSKNYYNDYSKLISGEDLLALALKSVRDGRLIIGSSKFVYVECEDKPELKDFYIRNSFWEFDKRLLERDETGLQGSYLIQMIRYYNDADYEYP